MNSTQHSACRKSRGFSLLEIIVAVSILGIAAVALFQLFSISLNSTKRSEDHTKALIYARSVMDEALSQYDISEETTDETFEDRFHCNKSVTLQSSDDRINIYKITVAVKWPPKGYFEISSLRSAYAAKND